MTSEVLDIRKPVLTERTRVEIAGVAARLAKAAAVVVRERNIVKGTEDEVERLWKGMKREKGGMGGEKEKGAMGRKDGEAEQRGKSNTKKKKLKKKKKKVTACPQGAFIYVFFLAFGRTRRDPFGRSFLLLRIHALFLCGEERRGRPAGNVYRGGNDLTLLP